MRVWLLPIEPLEERYSAQWLRWFPPEIERLGHAVTTCVGFTFTDVIEQGQFLDVLGTNHWKATQLSVFAQLLHDGQVKDGDWVLCLDAWSPAVIQLAYMRDLGRTKFKIAGCFHAGSYDPWDMLGQHPRVPTWAKPFETSLVRALDLVFVATRSHADMLAQATGFPGNIAVTGFPLRDEEWRAYGREWRYRPPRVVFPHRLAPEKGPEEFAAIAALYHDAYPGEDVEWIRTKDVCGTKQEFYALMGDSRVAVSCARQETWGIAMLEAASLGCHPVVPHRLSYPELFDADCLYTNRAIAVRRIHTALHLPDRYRFDSTPGYTAIARMVKAMEDS